RRSLLVPDLCHHPDPPQCRHSRLGDLVPVDGRARKTVHKNRPCDLGSVRARTGVATVRLPKEILLRPVELARHGDHRYCPGVRLRYVRRSYGPAGATGITVVLRDTGSATLRGRAV